MSKDVLIVAVGSINADLVAEKSVTAQRANYAYGSNFEMNLGGKSLNVALTALALSNDVALISRIGNDIFGLEILNKAMKDGLITQYITIDEQAHTGIGHVRVDENGQYDTIVINGANWNLTEEDIDAFISDGYRPKFAIFNFETDKSKLALKYFEYHFKINLKCNAYQKQFTDIKDSLTNCETKTENHLPLVRIMMQGDLDDLKEVIRSFKKDIPIILIDVIVYNF